MRRARYGVKESIWDRLDGPERVVIVVCDVQFIARHASALAFAAFDPEAQHAL